MIGAARERLTRLAKARLGPFVASRQPVRVDLPLSLWRLSVGSNGRLCSGLVDLDELARALGTPFHLARAELLDRNAEAALPSGHGAGANTSGCDIFYSYKTNPIPALLDRLHRRGIGAEVISAYELWLALRLGVPPRRIIYNGPAKSPDSIRLAIQRGVWLINANSASEVELVAGIAAAERSVARIGIRVALPGMWGGQFGIASDSPLVAASVARARATPFVDLQALHFHRGILIRERDTLRSYVSDVLAYCDRLRGETGWHPEVLDVGGSLACPTVAPIPGRQGRLNRALGSDLIAPEPDLAIRLAEASTLIAAMVADHFSSARLPIPTVVMEPGRALTADTQLLLTTVVDVKRDAGLAYAVLDAGVNVAEPVLNEYHQVFSVTSPGVAAGDPYRLVGPICSPMDVMYNSWRLPTLAPGHVLAIMDSGAYFVARSSAFSFPRPGVYLQEGDDVVMCRRPESFADMVVGDDVDGRHIDEAEM